jgi:hypothetical protein
MDRIEGFSGTTVADIKCGIFYIGTNAELPFRGSGWYLQCTVVYGLEKGLIDISCILRQFLASESIEPHYFRKHIDILEKHGGDLSKLLVKAWIGTLRTKVRDSQKMQLSMSQPEIAGLFNTEVGVRFQTDVPCKFNDGREVHRATTTTQLLPSPAKRLSKVLLSLSTR